ncbi:MAG: conserved hypothetical protein [Methanobrevibacter sp. CfCl-M3]
MNSDLQLKLNLFKQQIKDLDDKYQILILGENAKKNDWWESILLTGLWQMCNGSAGFGIALFLFGWVLLFCGGWIWEL